MRQYVDADDKVVELANKIVNAHHPLLRPVNIRYLLTEDKMTSKGRDVWAKIKKASPMETYLGHGAEFILIVCEQSWEMLDKAQRKALIDHELCHIESTESETTGDVTHRIRGHDIEEFYEILARHGAWTEGHERAFKQFDLPLETDEDLPGVPEVELTKSTNGANVTELHQPA